MKYSEIKARHRSGRTVRAIAVGPENAANTIVYHHGFPASSFEALLARTICDDLNLRIVAVDRPGIGASDWYPERKLDDIAEDVAILLDQIGVQKFGVLGLSGGTPSAVATAVMLPERVTNLTIVSGLGPVASPGAMLGMNFANRALIRMACRYPSVGRSVITGMAHLWKASPIMSAAWFSLLLPKHDIVLLRRPSIAGVMNRAFTECFAQGIRGAVNDFEVLLTPWEAHLERIKAPTRIWHGDADTYVPFSMAKLMNERISGSSLKVINGAGHFMIIDLLPEILREMNS